MMRKKIGFGVGVLFAAMLTSGLAALAQTADQAWLGHGYFHGLPPVPMQVQALGHSQLENSAVNVLAKGIGNLWGSAPVIGGNSTGGAIVVGTLDQMRSAYPAVDLPATLSPEAFWIAETHAGGKRRLLIAGGSERGVLYGAFALVRNLAVSGWRPATKIIESPAMPIRWVDEWDNPDGSIERGYAGRSIFFEGGNVREDLAPVGEYGRLLASVDINGLNINNVNAAPQLIDSEHLKQLAHVADVLRPWGVRLAMSVDIASPQKIGGLATFDPLDPAVRAWWMAKTDEIYALIPDFAGFTVKADSEGQPGPASYGRTPADAANLLAAALEPHGGIVLYRAFVYNHHLDWRDPKADRARAAYDIFHPLDGQFADNVVIQTKEGPIDFQVREPVSPLFSGLTRTSQAMELQVTQEYTGQQRHLVYLAPMWKQVLDFDLRAGGQSTPVKEIISGKSFHRPLGGMVAVAGVGRDAWLGSPLALANLYAFGRLAWNPDLTPEEIAAEWTRQTLSNDPEVVQTVVKMLMQSWPAYENYTGPLGLQTLTDITGSHYGPNIESSERNGWGQWHRADSKGVGMDRSVAHGTGFAGQYPRAVAKLYEKTSKTPDELLLFFHHVPYNYKLHSGKTVIQYLYDSHYEGAVQAANFTREWAKLEGKIDQPLYEQVRDRLRYQGGHAIVWRDAVVDYFTALSGIADQQSPARNYPRRYEAEYAHLTGYKVIDVKPWEDAGGGKAVSCDEPQAPDTGKDGKPFCKAEWTWNGEKGEYDIAVQYFDLQPGTATFVLEVNGDAKATFQADLLLPTNRPHGDNSTRQRVRRIWLNTGDVLGVRGIPDSNDRAALDYVEVLPEAPTP